MTSTVPPKHYALLVGIDMYLNDGSRKNWNGESVSFNNLRGCVNDVRAVQEFLQNEFQVKEPCILTSSVPSDQPSSNKPTESPEFWPTFDNIKREFESITEKARGGDYFLFHFSGHGAQLQPTQNSPKGRLTDPSLITIDYCNSNAAVRGWQLNEWLKTLHEKNVRIIVILDSCYAGGSWRTGEEFGDCFTFRTPEKWKMVPNNSNDEAAVKETSSDRGHRDGEMETSWGMNPQGFTLLAACAANQQAEEKQYDGEYRGVFTFALLACLRQSLPDSVPTTYQNLRDQIHEWLRQRYHQQTPRVYGQDRLVFFGSTEPFAIAPIIAHIKADTICIPIGKFHGIHVGSEFTTCQSPLVKLSVDNVRDFQCSASIPAAYLEVLPQESYKVIPYRWSLGNEPLFVFVDQDLGSEFRQSFDNDIRNRIVGDIQISRTDDSSGHNNLFSNLQRVIMVVLISLGRLL
ncbi:hypothetical protein N7528_004423 [Penicillium herquei]|nr:hypothetical protein N7528_004423 [Penicillium herquei]